VMPSAVQVRGAAAMQQSRPSDSSNLFMY
jgi:hypothetical protein